MATALYPESGRLPFPYNNEVDPNEQLQARVLNALHWDPSVPVEGVLVQVENGHVTLGGMVKTASQRQAAESNVRALPDVLEVVNNISIPG